MRRSVITVGTVYRPPSIRFSNDCFFFSVRVDMLVNQFEILWKDSFSVRK